MTYNSQLLALLYLTNMQMQISENLMLNGVYKIKFVKACFKLSIFVLYQKFCLMGFVFWRVDFHTTVGKRIYFLVNPEKTGYPYCWDSHIDLIELLKPLNSHWAMAGFTLVFNLDSNSHCWDRLSSCKRPWFCRGHKWQSCQEVMARVTPM